MLAAALSYVARRIPVFPLHSSDGSGGCSCGKRDCVSAAKHPLTRHCFHDATTDPEQVTAWWTRWPNANIGMPTGAASGVDVLDVDVQHGGMGTLQRLEHEHGKLPPTVEVLTPQGGRHLHLRHVGRALKSGAGDLGPGLDTRGAGGYALLPPSVGANGRAYKFMRPPEKVEPAEPAGWLFELLEEQLRIGVAPKVDEIIPEGKRHAAMVSVAGSLRRRGLTGAEIFAALAKLNDRCRPPLGRRELEALAFDVERRYRPDEEAAIDTAPEFEPQPLAETVAVFRRHLHLPDPRPLYAALAAVAANRFRDEDPVWLVLIGPSGGGKTEILNALAGLEDIYATASLTGEAALLSGTPRKDRGSGATGGLLRKVGEYGILVLKDFGGRRQPGAGVVRGAVARPALRRDRERVLRRLLGEIEVPEVADEGRQDAAPLVAEDLVDQLASAPRSDAPRRRRPCARPGRALQLPWPRRGCRPRAGRSRRGIPWRRRTGRRSAVHRRCRRAPSSPNAAALAAGRRGRPAPGKVLRTRRSKLSAVPPGVPGLPACCR
jgi:hypothetical protein